MTMNSPSWSQIRVQIELTNFEVGVMFPNAFLEQGTSYALEDTRRRTKTHRFFMATEHHQTRTACTQKVHILAMTIPILLTTISTMMRRIFWIRKGIGKFYSRALNR